MLKIDITTILNTILKYIAFIICVILAFFAIYLVGRRQASPIPTLICAFAPIVVDSIIAHILIKNKHEDSPYFTPEHGWKYHLPIDAAIFLIIIGICLYL